MKKKMKKNNKEDVTEIEFISNQPGYSSLFQMINNYDVNTDVDGEETERKTEWFIIETLSVLDDMFKCAAFSDDKLEIKQLRADIWEFQMFIEEHNYEMSTVDYIQMAYDVLEIQITQYDIHTKQLSLAKKILSFAL